MRDLSIAKVRFNDSGLVPVVVQDATSKDVLMLAWSNADTLAESLELGKLVFWSRSRNSRWLKGETSGHFLNLVDITMDCDGDTILATVSPVGPACHNGTKTCFEDHDD
ncbi:MAG: phosphoribosyl-AMP cyclohydrolase [Actinomycetota bacterium]|jgi:phosphoribosyl-AMP cyclohydrolase